MLLNRDRLDQMLTRHGLDAAVATTPENVTYSSGYWALSQWIRRGPQTYVLLPAMALAEPVIIASTSLLDLLADQEVWIRKVRRFGYFQADRADPTTFDECERRQAALYDLADDKEPLLSLVAAIRDAGNTNRSSPLTRSTPTVPRNRPRPTMARFLMMAGSPDRKADILAYRKRMLDLLPNRQEARQSAAPILRGSLLGFFLGLLPGGGAMLSSFASYLLERRLSRTPEAFGRGAVAGVAGPEAANNAGAQASFVPLLCLGIPANAVIGVIMGGLLMQGVTPGPRLMAERPDLFWGVIASMFIGNLMLIVLNLPLVGLFVSLLRVPQSIMSVLIVSFCVIGAYSLNNSLFDVVAMLMFGIVGYALRSGGYDVAPLLLAFVLGGLFEQNLRQGLIVGFGDPLAFARSPISATMLAASLAAVLGPTLWRVVAGGRPTSTAEGA